MLAGKTLLLSIKSQIEQLQASFLFNFEFDLLCEHQV